LVLETTLAREMAFTIRRLGAGDEPVLALLARDAPDFDLAGRSSPEPALTAEDAVAYFADPSVLHWIAEEDGRVIGELSAITCGGPRVREPSCSSTRSASARAIAGAVSPRPSCRRCFSG
jgi:hypothetical protein